MTYGVFYTVNVRSQIAAQIDYLRGESVAEDIIENWFTRLFDAIDSLYELPKGYPVDQVQSDREGVEVRKLIFGDYLVFYKVDEQRRVVEVLSFIHGARRRET